ncbi:MAG TPA: hypothetical protein VHE55_14560 [Fimbriimonadaceae bacterium]|nr:hypothetical protein [Fimbriimonadaceae bacterium]
MNFRTITLCVAAFALSISAFAQDGDTQEHGSRLTTVSSNGAPGSLQVLQRRDVQIDLKLTAAQASRIATIQQKEIQAIEAVAGKKNGSSVTRRDFEQRIADDNRLAENVLNDDQKKRLQEIKLQLRGNTAILDPDVQKELDITDDQKAQIENLRNQQTAQLRTHMQNGDLGHMKMSVILKSLRQQLSASLIKLLTPEQSEKFKEMNGKPFQIMPTSKQG